MSRQKLIRFAANALATNVLEVGKPLFETIKGKWNETYFLNNNPIVLELACGKGEYTVGLAQVFLDKNFIGIDVKGDRLAIGSQQAMELGLKNVAFLRTNVEFLQNFFEAGEVAEIWITFPDPFNIKKSLRRRLTHPHFLEKYVAVIKKDGLLHLKTDNRELFDFTLEELGQFGFYDLVATFDLYQSELHAEHFGIKTRFEKIFTEKGFPVHYLRGRFLRN
ncbi:tRNA (guanosine(46)-N7)-methyltransferase TrmB [Runella defluvii]|uniref:tRNA (guanosine(46)-N7)-methyltransferase TrmB n=1 Tax=Runella defluvii TaxID=370973 RepID=UPI0016121F67|nr:tRNA (guanosine(46)-N7)-methyltransferase TrmB [Runella defluvii]